jgi:hypothetical protein
MGRHAVQDDNVDAGWTAIMNTPNHSEEALTNAEDMELFLRILPKPRQQVK